MKLARSSSSGVVIATRNAAPAAPAATRIGFWACARRRRRRDRRRSASLSSPHSRWSSASLRASSSRSWAFSTSSSAASSLSSCPTPTAWNLYSSGVGRVNSVRSACHLPDDALDADQLRDQPLEDQDLRLQADVDLVAVEPPLDDGHA